MTAAIRFRLPVLTHISRTKLRGRFNDAHMEALTVRFLSGMPPFIYFPSSMPV